MSTLFMVTYFWPHKYFLFVSNQIYQLFLHSFWPFQCPFDPLPQFLAKGLAPAEWKGMRRSGFQIQIGHFFTKQPWANVPNCPALQFPHLLNVHDDTAPLTLAVGVWPFTQGAHSTFQFPPSLLCVEPPTLSPSTPCPKFLFFFPLEFPSSSSFPRWR